MFLLADTQNTFYAVGIVYMVFMMLLTVAFLVALLVIINKLRNMQKKIKSKLDMVTSLSRKGKSFWSGFYRGMN